MGNKTTKIENEDKSSSNQITEIVQSTSKGDFYVNSRYHIEKAGNQNPNQYFYLHKPANTVVSRRKKSSQNVYYNVEASQSNQDKGKYVYYSEAVIVNKDKTLTAGESYSESFGY